MKKAMIVSGILAAAIAVWTAHAADVPGAISHQGRLSDKNGQPINTAVTMVFGIYAGNTAPTALWTETQAGVTVEQGIFSVRLGKVNPIDPQLFTGP